MQISRAEGGGELDPQAKLAKKLTGNEFDILPKAVVKGDKWTKYGRRAAVVSAALAPITAGSFSLIALPFALAAACKGRRDAIKGMKEKFQTEGVSGKELEEKMKMVKKEYSIKTQIKRTVDDIALFIMAFLFTAFFLIGLDRLSNPTK